MICGECTVPVQVRIPSALCAETDGHAQLSVSGDTVREALQQLIEAYPALRPMLWDDGGTLRPQVSVYVNDMHVRYLEGLETSLAAGDEVYVVPLVMGG